MAAPDFDALIMRLKAAHVLQKTGENVRAIEEYDALLNIIPNFPDILFLKATALDALGRCAEALPLIKQACAAKPNDANYAFHHGKILHALDKNEDAKQILYTLLNANPAFHPAWYLLGCISEKLQQFVEALKYFHQALSLNPNDLPSMVGYAWALHRNGQTRDAIPFMQHAVAKDAKNATWQNSLGIMYKATHDLPRAESCYLEAIKHDSKLFGAYNNLSTIYTDQKRFDEAHAVLDTAIKMGDGGMSRYYKCMLYFLEGNLDKALPLWDSRWNHDDATDSIPLWPFAKWDGKALGDKKLLVWGEQGIGDELMFASLLPEFLEAYPNCVLVCQKRLVPIFTRSFTCEVHPRSAENFDEICARTDIAAHCPIGDLLLYFKPKKTYAAKSGYLQADVEKTQYYIQKYSKLGGKLKIGISWHSSNYATGDVRTISLIDWLPVLRTPDVQFVSVQYGNFKDEVEAFANSHQVPLLWDDSVDAMKDMDALASQIASLDMVISVANSTVHVAGSLGVPVWVMLPEVPSWRWQLNGEDSMWYPHIKLFRQTKAHEWGNTIETIAAALQSKVS
jgi:tetratricopeptide (TPR) repeat protein